MQEILTKYFQDERIRYYSPGDSISADHYIRYRIISGSMGKVVLSVGSDEGEVDLINTGDGEKLEQIITALLQ